MNSKIRKHFFVIFGIILLEIILKWNLDTWERNKKVNKLITRKKEY